MHVLVAACEQFRGSRAAPGYRDGLALCVIDSVQSIGVTYTSVENVVARYRAHRREQGGDPNRDGIPELLATFDELDGPEGWARKIGNDNRTSTRGGVLKSEAIRDAARVLDGEGIGDTAGLRKAAEDKKDLAWIKGVWCAVTGQGRHVADRSRPRRVAVPEESEVGLRGLRPRRPPSSSSYCGSASIWVSGWARSE